MKMSYLFYMFEVVYIKSFANKNTVALFHTLC